MRISITSTILLVLASCGNPENPATVNKKSLQNSKDLTISCDLIDNWNRAKTFTNQYLEAMPEEHYDFRPTPEILSFAHEFLHVACVNYRYAAMIAGGNDCDNYDDVYNNPDLQSKKAVIAFVMNSYDAMINRLVEENDLSEPTIYYGWSCSKECLSLKGFEHQSHHRGKTAIYLRLKGITPPGHMLIDDWTIPKDISEEEWAESDDYQNYERLVDKD